MKNLFLLGFLLFFPLFSLGQEKPTYGDAIVIGSIGDASILIPMLASDSASHEICSLVYNGLVKYDKNLQIVGDLAEKWTISPDGKVITFYLRPNVKWHDGKPFTAWDVWYGYKTIIDPKTPTPYSGDFEEVKEVQVLNPHTLRVIYKEPFAPGLSSWGNLVVLPRHLLEGKDITQSPLGRNPIGTGPYRFVRWQTGQYLILQANPEYFEGRPYIDQVIYKIIPDPSTMFMELKAGSLDWMNLTPLQYARQTSDPFFEKNFKKYKYLPFAYTYLGFNLRHPFFRDKRVRQAISYAINREEIVKVILFGLGIVANGPYKPGTWYYNPNIKPYPYDPQKAKKLLEEAGWKDSDGDGILDKDGKPFCFTVLVNWGNLARLKTAEVIQWRLKQIGIQMRIRVLEWATFINEYVDKRRFEAVILGWSTGIDPDQYDIWHSSKTGPKELNFISYQNPEVDQILVEARRTFDQEKRKKLYYRFQEILAEDQPYAFLYIPYALTAIHARFHGIEPAPAGITYNFIRWWVPQGLQRYGRILP
jgi:peptide/nickel transport system substrate-binding protein